MRRLGLEDVEQQSFDFPNWSRPRCSLKVSGARGKRPTRRIPSVRAGVYSVNTPAGGVRGGYRLEVGRLCSAAEDRDAAGTGPHIPAATNPEAEPRPINPERQRKNS